jgi:oligopeptide transport system substrate-binding protein
MKRRTNFLGFTPGKLVQSFAPSTLRFCLLLAALLTQGCLKEEKADIVIINGAEPGSLDPAIITVQADSRIAHSLFEGLTRLNPVDATPIPALAEKWEISQDAKTYTFHLRTNAVWSTGEPITSKDVVYSWVRVLDPTVASEYAGQLFYVKNGEEFSSGKIKDPSLLGIKALDPYTVQIELINPTPFFLDLCALTTMAVVPQRTIEKYGDRWLMAKPLPTSGPYTLDAWRIHDKIRLRKNPRHWDVANIRNDVMDILPSESAMTAMNLYQAGQADVIWDKNLIPSELMDVLGKRPDCDLYDYLGTFFMRFNTTRKPFDDPRVRKALALTIDKKRIVERITKSGEKPATHLVPNGMTIYHSPEGYGYDPEQARKFLAEAGYPGGKGFPTFQYLFKAGETDKQIGVELQAMWRDQLGIHMELRPSETKVYYTSVTAMDYEVARSSWIGDYNDPNTFLDMFVSNGGNNRTGWKNPEYDNLLREGNRQLDVKKREEILRKAETLLIHDDLPIAPIYFYAGVLFYRTNELEGIYNNLLDEHPFYAISRKKPKGSF